MNKIKIEVTKKRRRYTAIEAKWATDRNRCMRLPQRVKPYSLRLITTGSTLLKPRSSRRQT
jgi:hypothetical protein